MIILVAFRWDGSHYYFPGVIGLLCFVLWLQFVCFGFVAILGGLG